MVFLFLGTVTPFLHHFWIIGVCMEGSNVKFSAAGILKFGAQSNFTICATSNFAKIWPTVWTKSLGNPGFYE